MNTLHITEAGTSYLVRPENIVRIQSMNNYSKIIFTDNGRPLIVSKALLWVQNRLPPDMFARVHRSHLVNKLHVQGIKGSSEKWLILTNGDVISVSRRKKGLACRRELGLASPSFV